MTLRLAKQFTLPTIYIPGPREYTPQPAHTEALAEERRGNPSGTLILERQYIGAVVAKNFYDKLTNKDTRMKLKDTNAGISMVAAAALGSARLSINPMPEKTDPAFRRLRLPTLVSRETGLPISAEERTVRTNEALEHMVSGSEHLYYAMKQGNHRRVAEGLAAFARDAGEAAVWVTVQQQPEITQSSSPVAIQKNVLRAATGLLYSGIQLARELGTNPSLAMLADSDTDWTKFLSSSTHHGALRAFKEAQLDARATTPMS